MEINTNAGKTYTVVSSAGCTVSTAEGKLIKEIAAGQDYFTAISGKTVISDDAAVVQEVFKLAPYQKLRLLGVVGGDDNGGLPAGYTLVEYLESTGTQYCGTNFYPDSDSAITFDFMPIYHPPGLSIWSFANADADRTEGGRTFKFSHPDYVEFGDRYFHQVFSSPPKGERQVFYLENGRMATSLMEVLFDKKTFGAGPELTIFRNLRDTTITNIRIYQTVLYQAGEKVRNFVSAVDPNGRPCMYDRISQTPQYNRVEGADFVVGIETQTQLNKLLANLPDRSGLNTGELQIRLAANLQNDSNFAALEDAASKNWEITQAA